MDVDSRSIIEDAPLPDEAEAQLDALRSWLHQLLAWQIDCTRFTYGALADDEYRGLYISKAEAELLGRGLPGLPPDLVAPRRALKPRRSSIEQAADPNDALLRVGRLFGLKRFERDVLLLALLPVI